MIENLIGRRFNMLTVIGEANSVTKYKRRVECVCDCGNKTIVTVSNLKCNHTTSCGCYLKLRKKESHTTHGMSRTREHTSYRKMIERCYNPKDISYPNYGAKGIKVCDRWLGSNGFINFLADMGKRPIRETLDRYPDKKGDYGPENCRWATYEIQGRNKTNNVFYEYNGERMTQTEWANRFGVSYSQIWLHLKKGKSFSEIVEFYNKKKIKNKNYVNGTISSRSKAI